MTTNWTNKIVAVTGGSRGLGWHIGNAFARRGARLVLIARDAAGLEAARNNLGPHKAQVTTIATDIKHPDFSQQLHDHVQQSCGGRLDVLVNCAGISARGLATETTPEQFQLHLEMNFLATVRCTQAGLPFLRHSHGHLVNIGSLASKSPGKFLGPYPASKYAVAAYTHQLRLELREERVHVLLVCPGPIRREDAGQRYDAQTAHLPPEARAPAGGTKLRGIEPSYLAERIVRACERREVEVVVPGKARLMFAISQLWPALGDWILSQYSAGKTKKQT